MRKGPGFLIPSRARAVALAAGAQLGSTGTAGAPTMCQFRRPRGGPGREPPPLAPSLGQPGSDPGRPADESWQKVEASPGLPWGRAPRSTLRKLVFLRSEPQAGYIVLLRWTGEARPAPLTSGTLAAASPGFPPRGGRRRLGSAGSGGRGTARPSPPLAAPVLGLRS